MRGLPYGQISAMNGVGFDVTALNGTPCGLTPLSGDLDGLPGQFTVTVDRVSGGTTLYLADANEVDNAVDDGGDGLVDEGKLFFEYESLSFLLVDNIESCVFSSTAGTVLSSLQIALRDRTGRLHRASIKQKLFMRNN